MLRNRIVYLFLTYGLDLLFVLILLSMAISLSYMGLGGIYLIPCMILFMIGVFPLLRFYHEIIGSIISPVKFEELYVQTVASILSAEFFDDMLKTAFNQILDLLNSREGVLVFFNHKRNEFDIFYHKNEKRKIIRGANVELNNLLYNYFTGPDDIIIKNQLDPSSPIIRTIINEIEKFNGEIVVPIYYHETCLGIIVIGSRSRNYSTIENIFVNILNWLPFPSATGLNEEEEKRLLKLFASRIAILSINSFFFHQILEQKELKKEYELASKIGKKLLPGTDFQIGRISITVYHKSSYLMTRDFYDIFINDTMDEDIRISAYRIHEEIKGTSVLIPGIQVAIQSYARLGFNPAETVLRLAKMIREKNLLDSDLMIFHSSIKQNGEFTYFNTKYPFSLIYKKSLKRILPLRGNKKNTKETIRIEGGDIIIISSEDFFNSINSNISKYSNVINSNCRLQLKDIKTMLLNSIIEKAEDIKKETMNMLLILARMEDVS